jgi:hypothetical protein
MLKETKEIVGTIRHACTIEFVYLSYSSKHQKRHMYIKQQAKLPPRVFGSKAKEESKVIRRNKNMP